MRTEMPSDFDQSGSQYQNIVNFCIIRLIRIWCIFWKISIEFSLNNYKNSVYPIIFISILFPFWNHGDPDFII